MVIDPATLPTATAVDSDPRHTPEWRRALQASLPVGIGLIPLGIALGVLVVQQGLNPWWAMVFTSLIYAGSLEFVAVGMVAAMTPLPYIALTALLVNFRHVFYALSFPLDRVKGGLARFYSMFALTDEAYAMSVTGDRKSMSGRVIVYSQLYLHAYWIGGAILGATAAQWIPDNIVGLDFALTALFVVLSIEAIRAQSGYAVPAMAVTCALIARLADPDHMLPIAMGAFVSLLIVRYFLSRRKVSADA
ncbi:MULTISPECIES: AzlC family ABC transporter permease [unclassified Rhodococcus (in: high G+C Gram-positive bacteria)]|uniref:AzlC family ABC transporter permease n=1 Tax=unclassified Rhodococcus (in: high G+C Gram-positive bacteria) TaxID=192944 RepID=UPI00163A7F4F|nr:MULTISPECIES: AzlC family ABC transporter permease [unclassified Rhodococcus (in: high G+C Gram-positive bacteria)]MBC2640583.1 AzlC family ABC transporter permease [Rhodococcus sp. 3A]MBC2894671.1 AzlC family ABC transporter permease [Rhodococcus sp. 4CII]